MLETEEGPMQARVGDMVIVRARRPGEHDRHGVVLDVRGVDGEPPFLVRWAQTGKTSFYMPELDAEIFHPDTRPPGEG